MGEIKSTLDLVMERTRHLTLNEDEKRRQRIEGGRRRLAGLIQQYADGALPLAQLENAMRKVEAESGIDLPGDLVRAVLERIDPEGDNTPWHEILQNSGQERVWNAVATLLGNYRTELEPLKAARAQAARRRLAADGITGTAVAPNPQAAAGWPEEAEKLHRRWADSLAALDPAGAR